MQDLLRRMRLREELLSGTEKAPTPKVGRNPATEKQIGAILLPQNRHLAPVVRNHETPPMEPTSSGSQGKTEGGQTRSERIAEQLGRFHDGYQKYRHPVECAKAQAKEKLREKFKEKAQETLGAEHFAKLQKHAAAYQKYRHPVRHVKRKAKQLVKKQVERVVLRSPWFWGLVGIMLVSFFLVMLIATIWNSMSGLDKLKTAGKATACATTGVGCESLWNDTLSEGRIQGMLGALSPGSAEGAIQPRQNSTSGVNSPAGNNRNVTGTVNGRDYFNGHQVPGVSISFGSVATTSMSQGMADGTLLLARSLAAANPVANIQIRITETDLVNTAGHQSGLHGSGGAIDMTVAINGQPVTGEGMAQAFAQARMANPALFSNGTDGRQAFIHYESTDPNSPYNNPGATGPHFHFQLPRSAANLRTTQNGGSN